jgi:hypothetical protein
MEHTHFQATQAAAHYVADGLDDSTQEAFEVHLMDCLQCIEDVEAWRAIKCEMPKQRTEGRAGAVGPRFAFSEWQMAASLVGVGVFGAAAGWLGRATLSSDVDWTQTVVSNLPAVFRGGDVCTPIRLGVDTRVALVRVPGVARDLHIVALDSGQRELPSSRYSSRYQPDGSQLVRLDALLLAGQEIHLETRGAGTDSGDPVGCVTGETVETTKPGDTKSGP